MRAGDILSFLRLDASQFRKEMKEVSGRTKSQMDRMAVSTQQQTTRMTKAFKGHTDKTLKNAGRLEKGWWKTYGRVAVGFTIAYRAMNVFENGLTRLVELFGEAIRESGELATYQAKLSMFYRIATNATEEFSETFAKAGGNVRALADYSVRSLSSIEELTTGFDELAQAQIFVTERTTAMFGSLVAFTKLVAQTTGSSMRQVRQEFQALTEGHVKVTNQLVRIMLRVKVLTKEDIKNLKKMINTQEIIEKVARRVHEEWEKIENIILSADPIMALEFWRKSVRAVARESITLASELENVGNVFATIFKEHAEEFRETFSDKDMARYVSVVRDLGKILDWVLTKFEEFIKGLLTVLTVLRNVASEMLSTYRSSEWLRKTLSLLYKTFATLVIIKTSTMLLKTFGLTAIWLVKTPIKQLIIALDAVYARFLIIPALVVTAGLALTAFFQTILDMMPDVSKAIKEFFEDMLPDWMRKMGTFFSWLHEMDVKATAGATRLLEDMTVTLAKMVGIPVEVSRKIIQLFIEDVKSGVESVDSTSKENLKKILNFSKLFAKNFKGDVKVIVDLVKSALAPAIKYLREELSKLLLPADVDRIIEGLKKVHKEVELSIEGAKKWAGGFENLVSIEKKLTKELKKYNDELKLTQRIFQALETGEIRVIDLKEFTEHIKIILSYEKKLTEMPKGMADAWLAAALATLQAKEALDEYTESLKEPLEAIQAMMEAEYQLELDFEKAMRDLNKKILKDKEDTNKKVGKSYEQMLENIQDETVSVFERIFDGTIKTWGDLMDLMGDYFRRLLAQMAAQAVATPIVVPIVQSLTGGLFGEAGGIPGVPGIGQIPGLGFLGTAPTYGAAEMGVTWGTTFGAAALGAIGYSTLGDWLGLPQSKYSGWGAGAGAGLGMVLGGPLGAGIGAVAGGLFGGLFGGKGKDWKEIFGYPEAYGLGEEVTLEALAKRGGAADVVANMNKALTELSLSIEAQFMSLISTLPEQMQADMIAQMEAIEFTLGGAGWVVRESHVQQDIQNIMLTATRRMQEAMLPLLRQAAEGLLESVGEYYDFGEVDIAAMGAQELADFVAMAAQVALAWKGFTEPLEDIIAKHTLTDLEYQIRQLNIWYEEQKLIAEELGFGLELLNEAYALQIEAIQEAAAAMTAEAIEDFGANLQDQINQLTMEPMEYQILQIEMQFQAMLAQIAEWAAISDSSLDHLIEQAEILRDLQLAALEAQQEQARRDAHESAIMARIRAQQDAWKQLLKDFENAAKAWRKLFASLGEQIFEMQITMVSPQTAKERLAIVEAEIQSITGGMPIEAFLDSLGGLEERTGAIERLQELWGRYLELGGEAYQRPSLEYQQIFQQTLDELADMQQYMADYALETWNIDEQQLTALEAIENWTALLYQALIAGGWTRRDPLPPGFQHGGIASYPQLARVGEVPEAIIPLQGGAVPVALTGGGGMQFEQTIHITGKDPQKVGREVVKQTRSFLMNDAIFRSWTLRTAGGR